MTVYYIIITILLLGCLLALYYIFRLKSENASLMVGSVQAENLRDNVREVKDKLDAKSSEAESLSAKLITANVRIENLLAEKEQSTENLQKLQASFREEFRNLAHAIFDEKNDRFKKESTQSIDNLLKPFRENLAMFRQRVETIYSEENRNRGALQNEIKNLMELNRRITEETSNLTSALKGNSKVQGDWGEMILETILESSNLIKGIHYTSQETLKDESGSSLRPDIILNLPENKKIVIDSKVSLTAYVNHCQSEDPNTQKSTLQDHLHSVKKHVNELGVKRYQELLQFSPDFVIMFVPNEPAFLAALKNDPDLWNYAYGRKVIISSPTNLFALLKLVDDLWKRDSQNRNALEIADQSARMYDKFVGFVETLEMIGKNISAASSNYDKALGQLKTGPGNLIGRAEKLRRLGVKANKALSSNLTDGADTE